MPARLYCCRRPAQPKCLASESSHAALSAWVSRGTTSPLSPPVRIRCFGVRLTSNLCTSSMRSTLRAPICGRPRTTLRALGLQLLVRHLFGRPILYLVGHNGPPSLIIGSPRCTAPAGSVAFEPVAELTRSRYSATSCAPAVHRCRMSSRIRSQTVSRARSKTRFTSHF